MSRLEQDYAAALVAMSAIYNRIAGQSADLVLNGSKPGAMIAAREGGPAITFRHEAATAKRLGALSVAVGKVVPITLYPPENIQTTINAMVLRRPYSTTEGDVEVMERAAKAVPYAIEAWRRAGLGGPEILLGRPVANPDMFQSPGWPNLATFSLRATILAMCPTYEVPVKAPWGSQVVVGRFREELPGTAYHPLLDLFNEQPEAEASRVVSVDVIENVMGEHGQFECRVHKSFPLG